MLALTFNTVEGQETTCTDSHRGMSYCLPYHLRCVRVIFRSIMKSLSDNNQANISAVNLTSAHVEDRIYISNPYFEGIA